MTLEVTIDLSETALVTGVSWTLGHTGLSLVSNAKYLLNGPVDSNEREDGSGMMSGSGSGALPLVSLTIMDLIEQDATFYTLTVTTSESLSASVSVNVVIQGRYARTMQCCTLVI